jgi:hypothetical protein
MSNAITMYDETEKVAAAMVKSGYFQDSRDVSQAIVKILAGREMGFGPFASMTGVYIISGRPSVGANLMASAVKRSGRYDYRVIEMTETVCEIEYLQTGKSIGRSRFTLDDAKRAGTKNLDKYPRNMLFARAMSNGVRWYVPDVFEGAAVYTPEELGADVTESGEVIPGTFSEAEPVRTLPPLVKPALTEAPAPVAPAPLMSLEDALNIKTSDTGELYGSLETTKLALMANSITKKLRGANPGTPEEQAERQRKHAAIDMILAHRDQQAPK